MILETLIPALQIARAVAWGLVLVLNGVGAWRVLMGCAGGNDFIRSAISFVACSEIAFSIHWLIFPAPITEMSGNSLWAGSYILSITAGLMLAWVVELTDRARKV